MEKPTTNAKRSLAPFLLSLGAAVALSYGCVKTLYFFHERSIRNEREERENSIYPVPQSNQKLVKLSPTWSYAGGYVLYTDVNGDSRWDVATRAFWGYSPGYSIETFVNKENLRDVKLVESSEFPNN